MIKPQAPLQEGLTHASMVLDFSVALAKFQILPFAAAVLCSAPSTSHGEVRQSCIRLSIS